MFSLPSVIACQTIARCRATSRLCSTYASFTLSPDFDFARVRLFLAGDHAEERGFTRAVGPDHADDSARRQREIHIPIQQFLAVRFGDIDSPRSPSPEPRPGRDIDLDLLRLLRCSWLSHLLIRRDARFALGLPGRRRLPHPFQLARQAPSAGLLPVFSSICSRAFSAPARRIIALPRNPCPAIQFQNPPGHVVQKISIVRHRDDGARISLQMLLQPADASASR